jgi:hypothetical protein
MRYMFRSYDHLEVELYTSQLIVTGVRFRSFRLTQLYFNNCSLFYSNSPFHVSVVRPSSFANIYITKYHEWREVQGFPSNATLLQYLFNTLLQFSARRFGRTTIFMCHFIHQKFYEWRGVQRFPSNATLLK